MAQSDKVQSEDIIEKDLFDNTIKSTSDLIKELKKLETGLKAVNKQSTDQLKANKNPKTAKEIKDVNKALDESAKSKKSLLAVEKEIKKLTDDEIKQNEILKRQERDRIALLKLQAIEESKTIGREEKLLALNAKLRLERKSLLGTESDYLQRLKQINSELDKNNAIIKENSDKQKQQSLNVGNYSESIQDALEKSSVFGGIIQKITGFVETYESIILAKTSATKAETVSTELSAVSHVTNTTAIEAETVATEQLTLAKRVLNAITSPVGLLLIAAAALVALSKAVYDVNQSLQDLGAIAKGAFDDKLWLTGSNNFENLARATISYRKEVGLLQLQLQELEDTQSDLGEIASDETLSLGVRRKATEDLQKARIEASKKNLEIAQREIDLANLAVKAEESRTGVGAGNAVQEFYDKQIEAKKKLFDATDRLGDLERTNEQETRLFNENETIAQIELLRSKKLGADSQVEILKKQVEDEQTLLSSRRQSLKLLTEAQLKAQNEEIQLLTKFGLKKSEISDLINTKDAVILANKLKALTVDRLSEGQQQELAKVILEVQKNELDRGVQKNKLDEKEIENKATLLKLANDLELITLKQESKIADDDLKTAKEKAEKIKTDSLKSDNVFNSKKRKATEKAIEEENNARIEAIRAEEQLIEEQYKQERDLIIKAKNDKTIEADIADAELQKLNEQHRVDLENMANDEIAIVNKKNEYLKELRKQQNIEILKDISEVSQFLGEELDKQFDKRQKGRDKEIEQSKTAIERQQKLAEKGQANSLAFEEQELAKREQANEDEQEKEARQKEILALVEQYNAFLIARLNEPNADPNTAPARALSDTFLSKGIAKGLVQFASDGNNMINGEGTTTSDSIPFMLSKKEAVIKASENIKHNDAVVALNAGVFDKVFSKKDNIQENTGFSNIVSSMALQSNSEIKGYLKVIADKPVQMVNVDSMNNLIETIYKSGMKTKTTHKNRF